jgi:tetratricopeptide (TPR) repeat protein
MIRPAYILGLLLTLVVALATSLQPEARTWRKRTDEGGLMGMLFGDGRRMFANHFTAKADQYFHSGYYPSIFDQRSETNGTLAGHVHDEHCQHETAEPAGHVHDEHCDHKRTTETGHEEHSVEACDEKTGGWDVGQDWIARFGRNFRVTEHTHLGTNTQRELLPWLKISAELDPHQINTYLVASYWLRQTDKSVEAEKFIREGLEANPKDCELLFELGQIYLTDRTNTVRATRLFELAIQRWDAVEAPKEKPNLILLANLASHLARLAEARGDLPAAIAHLERARQASPQPEVLAKQIEELKLQLRSPAATNAPPPR